MESFMEGVLGRAETFFSEKPDWAFELLRQDWMERLQNLLNKKSEIAGMPRYAARAWRMVSSLSATACCQC